MSKKVHYSYCDKPQRSLTMYFGSDRKVVAEDNEKFDEIFEALKNKEDSDVILAMVDKALAINKHCRGLFVVVDGRVTIDGKEVPDALSNKIIAFEEQGVDVEPLVYFWKNLVRNPSFRSRQQLYRFLDANDVPIVEQGTKDVFTFPDGRAEEVDCSGFFVSWKSVTSEFKDWRTKSMDNSPGVVVEMERAEVNDDPNVTCSHGLHVAAWDYAFKFMQGGGKYVKVYVDPADVVSVPVDYDDQKMRACRYYVVEEMDKPDEVPEQEKRLVYSTYDEDEDWEEDDEDWEEDDEDWDDNECEDCDCYNCTCYD